MLRPLGELLRDILLVDVPLAAADRVSFQPPDSTFRADVANHPPTMVNAYLVDVRENRQLRTNGRTQALRNGTIEIDLAPDRLDCHYLLSAWSATQPAPGLDPALDEHATLYTLAESLTRRAPLNPARVYPVGDPRLGSWPVGFQDVDLPTVVLPPEGFPKASEFWTTMGSGMPWKPMVYLVVTVPVVRISEVAGPPVTTLMSDYRQTGVATSSEVLVEIGGEVRQTLGGVEVPVIGAWVQLQTLAGVTLQLTQTDATGRFTLQQLRTGTYRVVATAVGLTPDQQRTITVPSPTGEYDLVYP